MKQHILYSQCCLLKVCSPCLWFYFRNKAVCLIYLPVIINNMWQAHCQLNLCDSKGEHTELQSLHRWAPASCLQGHRALLCSEVLLAFLSTHSSVPSGCTSSQWPYSSSEGHCLSEQPFGNIYSFYCLGSSLTYDFLELRITCTFSFTNVNP